jgi:hypothetical protein
MLTFVFSDAPFTVYTSWLFTYTPIDATPVEHVVVDAVAT